MGIFSALFLGIASLSNIARSERKSTERINAYMDMRVADGFSRVANEELEQKIYSTLLHDWARCVQNNRLEEFFGPRTRFFYMNPADSRLWIQSESEEQVIAAGYAPKRCASAFSMKRDGGHSL